MAEAAAAAPAAASNGAVEQSPLEQFMAIANANGGLDDDTPAVIAAQEPAAPADGKPALADAVDPNDPAKDAGKKPDGPKPADWAKLREERRQWKAASDKREAALAAKEAEIAAKMKAAETTSPERIRSLIEAGNFDAVAQAMGAKSWEELNSTAARAFATPEFRRIRELEEKQARIEAERAEERRQLQAQQQEAQRQQAERAFFTHIETETKGSADPIVKALAEEPEFIGAVYQHMAAHYTATGEELDVSDAAQTIVAGVKQRFARWAKIQGLQPTPPQQAETTQVVTPDRAGSTSSPRGRPKHVARTRAAEAAPSSGELSHAEQVALGKLELQKALDEDLRLGRF